MATSTLVQFISAGEKAATSNRSQEETFLAGGAIAAGDWVALDVSQTGANKALYVIEMGAGALPIPCGVALTAAGVSNTAEVWVTSRF